MIHPYLSPGLETLYPVCLHCFSFRVGSFVHFALKFRFVYRLHVSAQLRSFDRQHLHISVLGYSHRLAGVHDPTKVFWVIEMLKGYGKLAWSRSHAHNPSYPSLHFATDSNYLFCTEDGRAVSRHIFTNYLALIFRTCGLDPAKYKGYSFRVGAATLAVENGFSDGQIRLLGRWKSDAFRKYIWSPGLRASIVAT